MKNIVCFCFLLLANFTCIASNYSNEYDTPENLSPNEDDDSLEPEIYSDVSKRAIEKAAAPNGISAMIGVGLGKEIYDASISGSNNFTENKIKITSLVLGAGYQKTTKKNLVMGIDAFANISKKKQKHGEWHELNAAYNEVITGNPELSRSGSFKNEGITPTIEAKLGYQLKKYKTCVFTSLGVTRVVGQYNYTLGTTERSNVRLSAFVTNIGFGAEKRFSKKFGLRMEYSCPVKKSIKKVENTINPIKNTHKVKISKSNFKLLGVYNIGNL